VSCIYKYTSFRRSPRKLRSLTATYGAGAALASVILLATLSSVPPAAGGSAAEAPAISSKIDVEIARVAAEIDGIEAAALERLTYPPNNQVQAIELLGKLLLFDSQLSVNRNEACAFCHMPETGFTGPVSELNRTFGSYPGSVRARFSNRKPQTHAYAAYAPVLHYNRDQGDMVGGNFWDRPSPARRRCKVQARLQGF